MKGPKQRFADLARRSFLAGARSRWTNLARTLALVGTVSFGGCGGQPGTESGRSGLQPTTHMVNLTWDPSTSGVVGYNVYRGTQSGGPYTKLNTSPVPVSLFTDNAVQAGKIYFYVTTAVDSTDVESVYSNEVSAAIPTP